MDQKEEGEEIHTQTTSCPNSIGNKFGNLNFRAKLKARGRPKRNDKQLTFNKSNAHRAEGSRKGRKRKMDTVTQPASKRKRKNLLCPVCNVPITLDEIGVMLTDCCSTPVHTHCFDEYENCSNQNF